MDIIELHQRVHDRIVKSGGTEHTTDAIMWMVRAALASKGARIAKLEDENQKLRGDLEHATVLVYGSTMDNYVRPLRPLLRQPCRPRPHPATRARRPR